MKLITLIQLGLSFAAFTSAQIVPNRYIVEFDNESDVAIALGGGLVKRSVDAVHNEFHGHLTRRGIKYTTRHEYNSRDVFMGVSISLRDDSDFKTLYTTPGVKAVYPVSLVKRPTASKVEIVNATNPAALIDSFAPHVQAHVSELHARNILGKGVSVGVIDTGVDYKHRALGKGCFGKKSCKVIAGYDLVGDAYDGSNTPVPDADPYSSCGPHGTHVSGIIAADSSYGFSGVAPEAKLGAWRVFGCDGSAADDVIIDAMLRADKAGMDIISMSLGGAAGWTISPGGIVASRLSNKGRVMVIAAGNDGSEGLFYASSPGSGKDVISVASAQAGTLTALYGTTSENHKFMYYASRSVNKKNLPLYVLSPGKTDVADDGCAPLPESTPDLSKYAVVIRRGTCLFLDKTKNAAAKGAKTIIFYNNGGAPLVLEESELGVEAVLVSPEDGAYIVNLAQTKPAVTVSFPAASAPDTIPAADAGKISAFSTYGPTFDADNKPAVTGIGGNVLSTWPVALGNYAIISGTSMATPQIAGVAALMLSQNKNLKPKEIMNRLATQAKPVKDYAGGPLYESVSHQGGGLVNAYCSVFAKTTLSTSSLTLNDTEHFKHHQKVKITNNGKRAVTYTLSHVAAGTVHTYPVNSSTAYTYPVPLVDAAAKVSFKHKKITLAPKHSTSVEIEFVAPRGVNASQVPVYSGFIKFATSTKCESKFLPYSGIGTSLRSVPVFSRDAPTTFSNNRTRKLVTDAETFRLSKKDYPVVTTVLSFGTPFLSIDLVPGSTTLTGRQLSVVSEDEISFDDNETLVQPLDASIHQVRTVPYGIESSDFNNVHIGGLMSHKKLARSIRDNAVIETGMTTTPSPAKIANPFGVKFIGHIDGGSYLARSAPGSAYTFLFNGTYTKPNGQSANAPNGQYKIFLRALRVSGNPAKASDWDTFLSPTFTLQK